MSMTVGALARRFGLSRSTLLYYDAIGLLRPAGRGSGEYRRYTEAEAARLEAICAFRRAGLPLRDVAGVLDGGEGDLNEALVRRFVALDGEMEALRGQQGFIARLLHAAGKDAGAAPEVGHGVASGAGSGSDGQDVGDSSSLPLWERMLSRARVTGEEVRLWHEAFARDDPDGHARFMELLGADPLGGDARRAVHRLAAAPHRILELRKAAEVMMERFFEVYEGDFRQGPGTAACTARALGMLRDLPPRPRILDAGCGSGAQTLDLAALCAGDITAFDIHQPFLDRLRKAVAREGLGGRVRVVRADMAAPLATPELAEGGYDVLWSEGALYVTGFDAALEALGPLVRPGGWLAASELTWLVPDPPGEALEFWSEGYSAMRDIEGNIAAMTARGFEPVGHFVLPDEAWLDSYYTPKAGRIADLRARWAGDDAGQAVLDAEEHEARLYRQCGHSFGYVFYVARRRG